MMKNTKTLLLAKNRTCPRGIPPNVGMTAIVFLYLLFSFPSSASPPTPDTFKVGCILSLTGDLAMQNNALREGIELARDKINADGGIHGKPIELFVEDNHLDQKLTVSATRKFLSFNTIQLALASSYSEAMSSGILYERAKIPLMILWDASPEIDALGKYQFSIGPWIPGAGERSAEFAFNTLGLKSVAIVSTEEEWSQGVQKYFSQRFAQLGGKIVKAISVLPEEADFGTVASSVKNSSPDGIFAPLTYNILGFYKKLHALGWTKPTITSDILSQEIITQDPAAFEGAYVSGLADPKTPQFYDMEKAYLARYGRKISQPWLVATGYDALTIASAAASRTSESGEEIAEEIYKIKEYLGTARAYSFNAGGSAPAEEKMFQVKQGILVSERKL